MQVGFYRLDGFVTLWGCLNCRDVLGNLADKRKGPLGNRVGITVSLEGAGCADDLGRHFGSSRTELRRNLTDIVGFEPGNVKEK